MENYVVTVVWQKPNGEKVIAYTVEAANSPSEAMDKVNRTSPDIVAKKVELKR